MVVWKFFLERQHHGLVVFLLINFLLLAELYDLLLHLTDTAELIVGSIHKLRKLLLLYFLILISHLESCRFEPMFR
jgi:hypothetical protein